VRHRVGAGRFGTEPGDLVLLVASEVALEPIPPRRIGVRTFPGEDVGGDATEEPAIVGSDYHAAGELGDRILQRRKGFSVQVIGRLIQQQHIAALLQREREVEPVAFPAGAQAGRFLLIGAFEAEGGQICA